MRETEPLYITRSKQICREMGMDPNELARPKRFLTEEKIEMKRKEYSEILSVVSYFSNKLAGSLEAPILITISDAEGYLLEIMGNELIKSTVETLGIKIGGLFATEDTGTNVISLALEQGHPISIIGEEHYHTSLFEIACYGAPFYYKDESSLLGSVCIMTPIMFRNPLLLNMLSQTVETIERELLLRKQNRQLNILNQILISRTRNGIMITNEKGIIIEFNEYAEELSKQSRNSVLGKCIYDLMLTGSYFKRVLEGEEKFENEELKFTADDGSQIVCLFDIQPIYENNKLIGAFGQYRDITDRHVMEEKIKEAEKDALAGRIAAGIAHEIRNPLTTVRGYLQFLQKETDDSISELFSGLLIPEIDRANKIISDFLRISKPSRTKFESIPVNQLITDYIYKFLKSESFLYNVDVEIEIDPSAQDLEILCSREELLQVFINLFQNSLHAKRDVPLKINIQAIRVDSSVQFIFSDNGKGISSAALTHIFEPFYSTKDEGTGLGLAVSRKIIESHGGSMHASSDGSGTKFMIEIPYAQQ